MGVLARCRILFHADCRAASTNLTVVVTTFVAIVFGLCSTLVLLNIVRRRVLAARQRTLLTTVFAVPKGAAGPSHFNLFRNCRIFCVGLRPGTNDGSLYFTQLHGLRPEGWTN